MSENTRYIIPLTLALFVRRVWMTNRNEDDEEEERPEELDDQLDLYKRRTWEQLQVHQIIFPLNVQAFCEVKMWPPYSSCGMWCSSRAGGIAAWKMPSLQTATWPWCKAGKDKMWWEREMLSSCWEYLRWCRLVVYWFGFKACNVHFLTYGTEFYCIIAVKNVIYSWFISGFMSVKAKYIIIKKCFHY